MKDCKCGYIPLINRILLGLVMLVPGLMKLGALKFLGESFTMNPSMVSGMLSGMALFSWAPSFWAWVLLLSEIVFGLAILANYKVKYAIWPPALILVVATFTAHWGNPGNMLVHLALASNYLLLGIAYCKCKIKDNKSK